MPRVSAWLFLLAVTVPLHARTETGFLNRAVTVAGREYKYQVYLPREWTKQRKWPVILFLHGAGERGSDGQFATEVGLGSAIRRHAERFPFVALFPQVPAGGEWTINNWQNPQMQDIALAALERTITEFKGDRERVYLTGLSMGGYGALSIAARHPEKFAALAVVCGGVLYPRDPDLGARAPYRRLAAAVNGIPIWLFHGDADVSVPVEESRIVFEELRDAGGHVRYYEFAGTGHNSWDAAYRDPELPQWFLRHTLSARKHLPPLAEKKVILADAD